MTTPPHASARLSDTHVGILAGLMVVLCWSGFNIVSRFGSKGIFTPFDLAALRFGISGLIGSAYFLRQVAPAEWPRYLAISLFGGLGYALFVYGGFSFAPSAHAGIFVNGGIPLCTAAITVLITRQSPSRMTLLALVLSACGLLLIGLDSLLAANGQDAFLGDLLFVAAALSWAVFGILMRRWQIRPLLGICGIAFFSMLLYLPVYILWLPKTLHAAGWHDFALQGIYQGVIAALLAASLYSVANQKIGASRASMMLALVPAVTAIGAFLLLDEPLTGPVVLGIVIVSAGALLGALPGHIKQPLRSKL